MSYVVENSKTVNSTAIRRSVQSELLSHTTLNGCYTALESFQRSVKLYPNNPCLADRFVDSNGTASPYHFKSYAEINDKVLEFAGGVKKENMTPKDADGLKFMGIYMKNCSDWIIVQQACFALNIVTVPLYDTLGASSVEFIVNQTSMRCVVCSQKELNNILHILSQCPNLMHIIVNSPYISSTVRMQVASMNRKIYTLNELCRIGQAYTFSNDVLPP